MPQKTAARISGTTLDRNVPTPHENQSGIFRSLFEQSGLCMASLDRDFRVSEANSGFHTLFGRNAVDTCGRGFEDFLHPGIQSRVRRQFDGLADGHRSRFVCHIAGMRRNEAVFPADLTVIAVHGADGRIESALALVKPEKEDGDDQVLPGQTRVLTVLDARILEGVASGVSTVDMATKLYLSRQGVEYHVTSMLRRLKAPNRAALVSRAYSMGLLSVGSWPPKVLPDCVR
jgi:PAS domain S-box-containing protein